jgi:hypothetical protein
VRARLASYDWPGNATPNDTFIPAFWPSRVPNDVLTEGGFAVVTDPSCAPTRTHTIPPTRSRR